MLQQRRIVFLIFLFLELLVCGVIGFFVYRHYQSWKEQERARYIVKLNDVAYHEAPMEDLKAFFEPQPDTVNLETPSWLGYQNKQTYNSDGLNERFDYAVEKQDNTVRIITVGDSFTHGDMIPTPQNWTELLEDSLNQPTINFCGKPKVEVINLGVSGYDVQYIARRYSKLGVKYHPDIIVWFESGSGFERFNDLTQLEISDCQKSQMTPSTTETEKEKLYFTCWKTVTDRVAAEYTSEQLREIIASGYREFFEAARDIPVLIISYVEPKPEHSKAMLERYLKGQVNARFLPIMPHLRPEITLHDGHPSIQGHKEMEQIIRQQLLQLQPKICPK